MYHARLGCPTSSEIDEQSSQRRGNSSAFDYYCYFFSDWEDSRMKSCVSSGASIQRELRISHSLSKFTTFPEFNLRANILTTFVVVVVVVLSKQINHKCSSFFSTPHFNGPGFSTAECFCIRNITFIMSAARFFPRSFCRQIN